MKKTGLLIVLFITLAMLGYGQTYAPAFGIQAPASCKMLKDASFTVLETSADFTAGGGGTGDDGSYANNPIQLPFTFSFFGKSYTSLYLNINGNITFDGNYPDFNSTSFATFNRAMIAPFWADIDLLLPGEGGVPTGKIYYKINPTNFIVIWENVGYYQNRTDKLNTFQLVLTNGSDPLIPNGGNVAFYYDSMNWTSGYASLTDNGFCGYPATVGITYGDQRNFFQIGRFDHLGDATDYDGIYPPNETVTPAGCNAVGGTRYFDGVKWLEKRCDLAYNISKKLLVQPASCDSTSNLYGVNMTYFVVNFPSTGTLDIKVDNVVKKTYNLATDIPASGPLYIQLGGLSSDGSVHTISTSFSADPTQNTSQTYTAPIACKHVVNCADCVTSFSPIPGQTYFVSAWVKESFDATATPPVTYVHSGVKINFNDNAITTIPLFRPSGPVVEGWQRIEGTFVVPSGAQNIQIQLVNENAAYDIYFDDVRIHPLNSNMKSFVYNPSTQKLVAELDENNFATIYEYDDEGILIRVKKETERGVMTIKETRSNQSKVQTNKAQD